MPYLKFAALRLPSLAVLAGALMFTSSPAPAQDAAPPSPVIAERDAAAAKAAQTGWYAEALKTRDQRLAWFRDARLGTFIHWGPYSVLGGQWDGQPNPGYAEHIMRVDRIPLKTYKAEVAAKFHPDKFDARAWVKQIKAAGSRYIIITSKHHDGFAIWPSDVNPYNIRDVAGFKRDPLKELVDAARAEGLHVGFYYSHAYDWEDPNGIGNDWDYDTPGGSSRNIGGKEWWNAKPEFTENTEKYLRTKAIPEVQELIKRYHPDILWFDTPSKLPFYQQAEVVEAVRKADPNVVINGRAASKGDLNLGDYLDTADRPAELRPTAGDWEAIPTTNESYGWDTLDPDHKPVGYFIQLTAKAAAKGGNILINIGPRGDGTLDPPDVAILAGMSKWMAVNGDSIHGTQRTPLDRQTWGDSTVKGSKLYLHVMNWPSTGKVIVGGLTSPVKTAYLLSDKTRKPLAVKRLNAHDVQVGVPGVPPDAYDTVVVVETTGPVKGETGRLIDMGWGSTQLHVFDAQVIGKVSYGDGKLTHDYVEGLDTPGNALQWSLRPSAPGKATVAVTYSTVSGDIPDGATIEVAYNGQTLSVPVTAPKGPPEFGMIASPVRTVVLGDLNLNDTNLQPITLRVNGAKPGTTRVFSLRLTPSLR
ncbi:MAG TPA: alpha-L-fucosidase [Asticcacaulis sp.]|nr:alpha-L-fucosidase [Asticcacaulis sp.]